jgi:hypothetical protein
MQVPQEPDVTKSKGILDARAVWTEDGCKGSGFLEKDAGLPAGITGVHQHRLRG